MPQITDYPKYYRDKIEKIKKEVEKQCAEAYNEAWIEWLSYVEKEVDRVFRESVRNFYKSYTPYAYERQKSLYNLLKIERINSGKTLRIYFDPYQMTQYRHQENYGTDEESLENGLYNKVFRLGWHGGAEGIAEDKVETWGRHPEPGKPYWRRDKWVRGRVIKYGAWGIKADIAAKSPLAEYKEKIAELDKGEFKEEFRRIYSQKIAQKVRIEW